MMIKFRHFAAFLLLSGCAFSAQADIQFAIGEPQEGSINSGIGQISGWAISDEEIVSVEAFIDGISVGIVPYGGSRKDVANVYPNVPNSEFSGWAMKWNYALLDEGEHLLTIIVTEDDEDEVIKENTFSVTHFKSQFMKDPNAVQLTDATIEINEDGKIVIRNALVEGELADIELSWVKTSQQFLIDKITYLEDPQQNQMPEAWAGDNMTVEAGSNVKINGSGTDPDGFISSQSWQQVSGPAVALVNADTLQVQFTAPDDDGSVQLRLTVVDNEGASDSDEVTINIDTSAPPPNQPPTANAGPNLTVEQGDNVVITGGGSDPDGSITGWAWSQVSGAAVSLVNADSQQVNFTAPGSSGEVRLRLTVTDDDGATDSDDVVVTVEDPAPPPNQTPTANAGPNLTVEQGDNVVITGGGSDPDGSITGWAWSQQSGPSVNLVNADSQQVSFTAPDSSGEVRLRLTVTDDDGATDSDDVIITVEDPAPPPNQSPTANAGPDLTVNQGDNVVITGGGSDPDGSITGWAWSQQSGPSVDLVNADSQEVSFTAPDSVGDIRLRLTVTDDDGATDSDNVDITVEGPDNTTGYTLQSMLSVINDVRSEARTCRDDLLPSQPAVRWRESLATIAQLHSMDMARQGYFSHNSLDGTTMGERVFPYWTGNYVGENIAASSGQLSDAAVVQAWLDSPPHCELLMDPDMTHAGVGVGVNTENGYTYHYFWTLDFGGNK